MRRLVATLSSAGLWLRVGAVPLLLLGGGLAFLARPQRQTVSELEKRTLAPIPSCGRVEIASGACAKGLDLFVADHFPARDPFVEAAFWLKEHRGRVPRAKEPTLVEVRSEDEGGLDRLEDWADMAAPGAPRAGAQLAALGARLRRGWALVDQGLRLIAEGLDEARQALFPGSRPEGVASSPATRERVSWPSARPMLPFGLGEDENEPPSIEAPVVGRRLIRLPEIRFGAGAEVAAPGPAAAPAPAPSPAALDPAQAAAREADRKRAPDEQFKVNGILVYGNRGVQPFAGSAKTARYYAGVVNEFAKNVKPGVKVHSVLVPGAITFYPPDQEQAYGNSEVDNLEEVRRNLAPGITWADTYAELAPHVKEPLYLRTDHHWNGLGAYYAYVAFCKAAGFEAVPLERMTHGTKPGYVGTLYAFTGDSRLRADPDVVDFWEPPVEYEATRVSRVGMSPEKALFIDRKASGYLVFLRGDFALMHAHTNVGSGRRALILKNSFGNPFTVFLLSHFDDVVAIDYRYFSGSLAETIDQYGITDLIAFNVVHAANSKPHARRLMLHASMMAPGTRFTPIEPMGDKMLPPVVGPGSLKEAAELLARGLAAAAEARWADAVEPLQKSLEIKLDPGGARTLARALRELGKRDEARTWLEKVVKADPTDVDAVLELGAMLVTAGRPKDARSLYAGLLNAAPGNPRSGEVQARIDALVLAKP